MNTNIKFLTERFIACAATLLLAATAHATPETLDWDTLTWVPAGNTNLSETYTIGSGDITVTFSGNTAGLEQNGADIAPMINQLNTGGLVPAQNALYVGTDYVDNSNPMVIVTIDFTGYPGGVGNFSIDIFDMDLGTSFVDDMTVTAVTPAGNINPTSIITGSANTQINANTVRGTAGSGSTSANANVSWIFGDAGTPVSGISQINIVWRNLIGTANPGLQWINIHDFSFDDPMADVELTKSVSTATAGAGESVVFTLDVVNNGPDTAPGVEVTDLLPNGFSYLSDNGGASYDSGSGVWTVGDLASSGTAQLMITAQMEAVGPWDNITEVTRLLATDPDSTPGNNVPAEDDQDNAAVTLLVPEIGTAKAITSGPTSNGDGSHTLTYTTTVVNSGETVLNNVQVIDNLAATFAAATGFVVDSVTSADFAVNPGFDGSGDTSLLAGTDSLAVAGSGTIALTVTVTPGGSLGPYNNTATAGGASPGGVPVTDDSTSGANPDPDGDGNPGNNSVPTPVTFAENPEIGTAKRVIATPVNNGNGSYTLTYEILVQNSGDVPLSGLQVVDDMAATFAGTTAVVVDSVTSPDFSVNSGYDGNGNNNVLAGTDTLATGTTGIVSITVTVATGGNLGTFQNTATSSGSSPGGTGVSDVSQRGANPDPDGDGNPGNNSTPTPISFTENPQIGLAKAVTAGPTNNGDGTHTLSYTLTFENMGDATLSGIQAVDNLANTFSGATGFVVDSVTSADFTVNTGYTGNGNNNLLDGTDSLALGATGTVVLTVTVTPGGTLGPYNNTSFAQGTSPAGSLTIDNSVDGLDPDPDGNGDPVDNVSPTPVTFGENPEIGTAKLISSGPTNNGDGTHTLTYTITVANSGDVALNNVQVVDNLATTFAGATGFVVDSVTSADFAVNAGYNGAADTNVLAGTDTLAIAATGTVDITVTVTPGGNLGPYNNSATADGNSPAGTGVSDVSTAGANPDPDGDGNPGNNTTPTLVTFGENPQIGIAKAITSGPTSNGDGTHTLSYTFTLENFGDVVLNSVQAIDNLATTFSGATGFVVDSITSADFSVNAGFDGNGNNNLLAGTDSLAVAANGTLVVSVTVTPGGNLGPYDNTAFAQGTSPGGSLTLDNSVAGLDPDPDGNGDPVDNVGPTPVTFGENPEIGTAKLISSGPTNNGDGTHTLTYTVTVNNSGDVALNNVQVVDNLATTFAGATGFVVDLVTSADFTVNAGYNGAADTNVLVGTDTLAIGATGTVDITVTVTPGGNLGPYNNSATADGNSPAGTGVSDVSTAGANPDPDGDGNPGNNTTPTPVTFGENPQIGIAKAITSGPTNNGDGTHTLSYTFTLENFGDVVLNSVQAIDNLATTFSGATGFVVDSITSADFSVNAGFDGNGNNNLLAGTDSLAVAANGTLVVSVTVTPGGNLGPYDNTAFAQGTSPGGSLTLDNSVAGLDPDPDGNGDPVDNVGPTPVTFGENPEIGTAKLISSGPTNNGDGTHTLTYTITVANSGDVALNNVQVVDNLATTFAGATGFVVDSVTSADFAVNAGYNGAADTNVLAGTDTLAIAATGTVDITVTVTPGGNLGPYNNSATANGSSPAGTGVSDVSNTGVNPDPDGDGDPTNNSAPTPVTFGESPEIGAAKSVNAPTNNGDGTFTLTYTVIVNNSGDVALNNLQVVDNLATTFAGATGFVVDSVTSADFAVNAGYNGAADTNLLAGTDTLAIGTSGTIAIQVTVTPGGTLGPYNNSATADGSSPAGTGVSDVSTAGANPDPDGDGNPGNNATPTPVSFDENPQIGVSKAITTGPTNNGDGSHTLSYTFTLENFGDVVLNSVQAVDNLAATFSGATGFAVDSITSADFSVNAGYDGNGNNNVLAGTDSLAVATTGTVIVTVTVTPGGNLGPYDNTAFAQGTSPGGSLTLDNSVDGLDPDPDGNGDPVDNVGPTPVTFGENPEIGTAKLISSGPTNNGDGTHTLSYTVTVNNSGDVPLSSVQVVDNLATTFAGATGFVVDLVTSADFTVNAGYNGAADTNVLVGTDTLAIGATGTVDITVTVTPGGNLGPYNNSATADGTSPAGTGVSDVSTAGANPDPDGDGNPGNNTTPTPVTFGENPQIGIAKAITSGPTNNGDGTHTLSYTFTLENFGDVVLNSVQAIDNLATTFSGATGFVVDSITSADFSVNAGFDGNGNNNLLAGTDSLAVAANGTLVVSVTVTPGGNLGPYDNTAFAQGTSPGGSLTLDNSVAGLDPDPDGNGDPVDNVGPTPVTFGENPEIGTAKLISSGPTNNGDGTHTLTYTVTVNNSGDVALNNVQVVDNLATTFAGATGFVIDLVTSADFAVNAGYNGAADTNVLAGTDTLAIAATGTVDITVTVTPGGNLGPYNNSATADGTSPAGTGVSDVSTAGANPDPDGDGNPGNNTTPTPVTFGENPQIGIAKAITSGPTNNGDGTHTLSYTFTLENFGDVVLNSVQAVDNLATTFSGATGFVVDSITSADFTVNAGYDGNGNNNLLAGTDSLAVATTGALIVTVTVTPGGNLGPYDNTAFAQGTSPGGSLTLDNSVAGLDPDPDGNGDPVDNVGPTPVTFGENPEIGTAKLISSGPTNNGDGTHTLTYTITVANSGDVALNNVQVVDELATTFSGATAFVVDNTTSADFAVNAGYNGAADTNVLAGTDTLAIGTTGTVDITVTVTTGGLLGPYNNSAAANGTSPAGTGVNDVSNTGVNPDPDGDGDPSNNSAPTPVTFGESPEIGTAKSVNAPTNNGDGTHTLTYTVTVNNSGDVALNNVQVVDNLATTFAGATGFVVDSVTSADFAVNTGYNGAADTNLLAGTDTLAIGASGTIAIQVTVTPGASLGPYNNSATADGTSPAGTGVSDVSTAGANPDPDGDGDPGNNTAPTPITFGESPEIGIAKTISSGPINNGDGTFTLTYTMTVANSGDVALNNAQVVTDLATGFASATGYVVDSVASADFAVNGSYDGNADTNLLAGTDTMAIGATGTIDVTITVTPGGFLGPYDCIAIATGTSPAGTGVSDISTDGTDPDPDGDGDPGNNSVPTTFHFDENPEIGIAKTISSGPTNNGDGTFTLTYTMTVANSGGVALNNAQVVTDLATGFASATGYVVDSVASADFAVNGSYDGNADTNLLAGTDTMAIGATGTIDVTITVTPGGFLGPYDCIAVASGTSPAGTAVNDVSTVGVNPDPDGDGDPGNNSDPTTVSFGESPEIGIAKTISSGPTNNGDGTFTLTYTMTVANSGDVVLNNAQVVTDLATGFASATGFVVDSVTSADFAVNGSYDGDADTNLLAGTDTMAIGATGTIDVTITVTPGGFLGPYDCIAVALGTSPAGTGVSDTSTDGTNPDPDGDGDPSNNSDPTTVSFGEDPEIGIAKTISSGPTNNGDGTFTLTYTMTVANSGDVDLNNAQVVTDLATAFAAATGFVVDSVTSADFTVNAGYDGNADTNLLTGTDTMAVGTTGTIDVTITVSPGGAFGPYDCIAIATGTSPAGTAVSDISTDGSNPDPDGDGDPGNNSDPTSVSFMVEAAISGNAWLDANIDDLFDAGETPLTGWIIEVLQGGVVVATVPVNPDGSYSVTGLPPGSGYSIQLRHPSSSAVFGTLDNITLPPGLTVIDQNLPIDPSGVVYDSNTRLPIPGVTVTVVDSGGTPLPASCLLPGQQSQVTGADGYYRFDLLLGADPACLSGAVFDIVFTTPAGYVPGISTTIPPTPGPLNATGLPDPFQVQPQIDAPMGSDSTLYYLSVMLTTGDPNIINNHIPIDPIAPGANLLISKRADRRQTVVGDLIVYTISISNPGAAISGLTVSDLIPAGFTYVPGSERLTPASAVTVTGQRPVLFSGINVAAAGTTELRYMLRVGAGVVQGDYSNSATPLLGGIAVGNTATATVTVTADPDFEQTSVIGSVFNDANGNGWQDDGEFGIPGVRLATVEGLLIETDAFGRYHIAGVDGGRRDRGRNFIIKVDPNTLPDGVEFTTENPRVQRITEGLLNRFDFGVNMPASAAGCCEQIDVKIGEVFFEDGSSSIRPEFLPLMQQLADRLIEHKGGTLYIEGHAEPGEALAYTPAAYTVTQHFTPRSIRLSEQDKRELDAIIEKWRGVENISVAAVGHTCNTRIAPKNRKEFKDNYELSVARAQTVAAYVRLGLGIAPEQVTVMGKGPDEPVASNATPEGGALNRRVELSISGQRTVQPVNAADLARDRANSIYNALRKLLGDELIRNINISGTTTMPVNEKQEPEMTSGTQSGNWLSQGAGALLGLLVSTAHADVLPTACTVDSCLTDKGYAIQILPSSQTPSPNDTRAALANDKRVDINGKFFVPVSQGGQLWATEDPTAAEPRLAVHGPSVSPVENGNLAMPISFFVYSNYPTFIERAEIQIYHGDDIDHIKPLALVPFKPGIYSRIDWDGLGLSRQLSANDELYYRVRAYDKKGRYDETHLDQLRLVSMEVYKRSAESDPTLLMPFAFGEQKTTIISRGPLDGNVLVLQPPTEMLQQSRVTYSLTPHFDSRKTDLKAQDRAEIDSIIADWRGAEDLSLHVIGHTDNIRIAPQNRKEFANNQVLSQARARAVANYVAGQLGMHASQVVAEGRADKEPIASNATASGRAQNRRVEMTITGTRSASTTTGSAAATLVEPQSNTSVDISRSLNEALYNIGKLNSESTSSMTGRVYADPAPAQSSAHALEAIYGKNNLRVQRIPVNGSRVRINGQHLGQSVGMRINGDPVPLDASGKYVVEYVMPVGKHNFDVEMIDDRGNVTERQRVPVEVSGQQIFMVALADFTLSDNNISGSIEPTSGDSRYDDDMLVEGRLAFYLKGKIKGKYLITAQMDSQEEELGDLFSNLFDKDPKSVFRRLDPDRYYPVYGDDSTTINDTDTQGRFYVRADWDKSRAVWGNFHTGLTGNEFAQYNRSLYGAQYQHQSLAITEKGEAKSQGVAFVSEAQTAFGHSEFLGTGGSLYYLRHQDILPGSEKAWIEVRDRDSNRVREVRTLTRGIDYEVDEIQGRIILARPLMLVSGLHAPGLIKDTPLDGNDLVLLVDYEYLPIGFGADRVTAGGSGKYWLSDDIAIGATYVDENRRGENYGLFGGDFLWKPGQGTYLKAEYAQSEATQSDRYFSADGGLTFDSALLSQATPGREGDAWGVEARVNSREAFNTEEEWVGGAWYRRTDDNFSVARRDTGVDTTEYGVELTGSVSLRLDLSVRASVVERELLSEEKRLSLQADYSLTDYSELSGEVRSVDEQILSNSATGLLLALRYSHKLSEGVEVYGIGQATLDNDSGRYDNNDLATLGVRVNLNDRTSVEGEYSTGHRGNGALLNLDYRLDDRHEVYGTFTQSADRTDLLEPDSKIALGHRSKISDQTTLFNERQFVEDRGHAGIAHVFGLDMALDSGWSFGLSVQQGDLETDLGRVDRDAATVTANYRSERLNWRGKVEYRDESGVSKVSQKLTTNRLDLKLSEDWRLLTRLNHAETEDDSLTDRDDSAVFTEAGIGFAYRPVANSRLNLLAKYTFLYDLPATFQIDGGTDQRSNIVSLEGIYQLSTKWELGGKLAQRSGELRTDRDLGQWFESTTNFAALRARYHLIRRWDAMLELRRLEVDEAQSTRTGWLLGLDRHINDNFRLGVGYNFTDFSDDLSNLDYDHDGWFINALGKY